MESSLSPITPKEGGGERAVVLIGVFLLSILGFFATSLYANYENRLIDQEALRLRRSALPSAMEITHVAEALQVLLGAIQDQASRPDANAKKRVEAARLRLQEEIAQLSSLPRDAAKAFSWSEFYRDVTTMNVLIDDIERAFVEEDVTRARKLTVGFASTTVQLSALLFQILEASESIISAISVHIEQLRTRASRAQLILNLMSATVAILAVAMASRSWRLRNRMLRERAESEETRAAELEKFAGRVAHDIRGPLTTAAMALGIGADEAGDEAVRGELDRGNRSVKRVNDIVDRLLRFARAGARPEPGAACEVRPLLEGLVDEWQPIAAEQKVALRLAASPSLVVACDSSSLYIVLENLLANAISHMGERPIRQVSLRALESGRWVRFEVEDTGPGISEEEIEKIWEPYFRGQRQLETGGIGLGLATVRRIVEAHGGKAGARSKLVEGSLFWLELPKGASLP
jgi:signal transduction histidine kinase